MSDAISSLLTIFALLTVSVIAVRCAFTVLMRGCQLSINLGMVLADVLALAAVWPIEWLIDQAAKGLALAVEYRAQWKIWQAEFSTTMPWDEFRRQMTGQPKVERDDYADALSLFGLVEPFGRKDMDARFRRIMQGVHPDTGGTEYLAKQVTTAHLNPQAKRMEKMSHKSELAIIREQQLARLREATGTPERFVADFACARHDRTFRVTFARFSPAQRFRCESVDKIESHQATIARLQGLLRPAEALRVRTEEVDFSALSCAWCAASSGWTLCAQCKTLVCGARSSGHSFTCRDSCGAHFQTAPLDALDAARSGSSTRLAIGHSQNLLPGKGLRK